MISYDFSIVVFVTDGMTVALCLDNSLIRFVSASFCDVGKSCYNHGHVKNRCLVLNTEEYYIESASSE